MARKGRDISGWLLLDKPAGITSTGALGRVRHAFGAAKAGHAGTLDPAATGLLAIAFGEATKTIPVLADAEKCYRFCVTFGAATDTDDAEGRIIATAPLRPSDGQIETALAAFRGDILQVPPQYSAVKLDGERAYDLAREGVAMALAARPLHVARLALVGRPDADHAELEMVCGKGGYVRSIARDLGQALGCLGHVHWLRRLWSGPFHVDRATSLDAFLHLDRGAAQETQVLPLESALADLHEIPVSPEAAARLRNGNPAAVLGPTMPARNAWASLGGRAVALGTCDGAMFRPDRVFNG